ncbi:MAG: hypothetical protein VX220_00255 [Pseudomonadota bacterium]|jgi:hypothetical protein|nr:hypothetical protein [Pseudomonadales bacterium]MEC7766665.1 hypothetical protein [Pseudomonadota bacterium]MEC8951506.1 hypothetical protein [Pseudomonadota bacterium]MEC8995153.1 hypothetical protein [Pseudomonadota bacterium]MED5385238.1 hypothetical protein [Pseudomonadota bacterium]
MMSEESQKESQIKDEQTSAILATSTIIIFFAVYWFFQIQSVRELLELAYG